MKKIALLLLFVAAGFCLQGQELIPYKCKNGKYGYKDKVTGAAVISCNYDKAEPFSEGMAAVKIGGYWGFIDKTGGVVISCKYDAVNPFSEGMAVVYMLDWWKGYGLIDKTGREVLNCRYARIWSFFEGLAAVKFRNDYNEWGFVNKSGKVVVPYEYKAVKSFSEGLAAVQKGSSWGFIDTIGATVIPLKYDNVTSFSDGVAAVQLSNLWGCVNTAGYVVIPIKYTSAEEALSAGKVKFGLFNNFAKNYVEKEINKWQQKGEGEKMTDWQQRVNETTRNAKAKTFLKEAEKLFISIRTKNLPHNIRLCSYDIDNEVFLIESDLFGNLFVPVPQKEMQSFRANWTKITKTPTYFVENDKIALAEMVFKVKNKTYKYNDKASHNYKLEQPDYNFDPIDFSTVTAQGNNPTTNPVPLPVKSDVDTDIPTNKTTNSKTFAVIIANEKYRRESQVEFAKNDGETFKKYCIQTLGLPKENVSIVIDATLNDIRGEIDWLNNVADAFKGEANIIFYYAGHGIPDESSKTSYLLPIDGYGSNVSTGYKLDDLYTKLGSLQAKSVIVFMDACFSGSQRSGEMLASARGVAIKSVQGAPVGNMIVFSAAQGDETAYPYREKRHGMFTYFLLKKLQETKGETTLGELGDYIETNVRQRSVLVLENRKSQTPTVTPSSTIDDRWRGMKLK